jgi:membrane protein
MGDMKFRQDFIPLLKETWEAFQKDEVGQMSAALTYHTLFSLFPLLILLTAALGFFLESDAPFIRDALGVPAGQTPQEALLAVVEQQFSPAVRDQIATLLSEISGQAATATLIGIGTVLFGASNLFNQLNVNFNKIWGEPEAKNNAGIVQSIKRTALQRLSAFAMVLVVGALLFLSLVLTVVVRILNQLLTSVPLIGEFSGPLLTILVSLALSILIFALLFKYLPPVHMRWSDVWLGALITAVLWEIVKQLLSIFLSSPAYTNPVGVVSSILVLMLWIFISSHILFLGAEFTEVYSRRFGSRS